MRATLGSIVIATVAVIMMGRNVLSAHAVDTPWVLGDEQSVACYTLSTKEDIPKPVGLEMHWTQPPAEPLDSTAKTPVSYWARVQPNFWTHQSNIALLGADYAKYQRLCLNETGGCDASGDCCIWHSNVHSCRAESGACEPWVAATNATDASGNEYTLVTHTAALEGGLEEWTQDVQLDNGDWIIIAHVKIMTFQCAVGATRLSAVPPRSDRQFPVWGIVLIAVFGALGVALCLYVLTSAWLKGAAARRAPKEGPCTMVIISVYKVASLWETFPAKMPEVLKQYNRTVRNLAKQHGCYEVKRIGETNFVIAASDVEAAVDFATQLQETIIKSDWTYLASTDDTHSAIVQGSPTSFLHDSGSHSSRGSRSQQQQHRLRTKRAVHHHHQQQHEEDMSERGDGQSTCMSDSESAWGSPGKVGVTIGLQYGDVRISHDPEANTYDYNGAVVSDAAMLADLAVSGQIYAAEPVFDALPQTVGGSHFLSTLCQWKLETGQQNIYKITSRGMPDINYMPQDALAGSAHSSHHPQNVEGGGVLAALDQATAGLAAKKVVVVCIRVNGSTKQVTAGSKQQLISDTLALDKAIAELASEARGHLQASLSGDFVVTFNAASNVANPLKRALTMLFDLQDTFEETFPDYVVQCGISAGQALVGTLGSRTQLYSPAYRQASALAGLCGSYDAMSSTHSPAPFCLLHDGLKDEVSAFCHIQYVDALVLPFTSPAASGRSDRLGGFNGILSLVEPKPAGNGGHEQDDEWMYELEAAAGRDPYRLTNHAWEALMAGDMNEANEFLQKRAEVLTKGSNSTTSPAQSSLRNEDGPAALLSLPSPSSSNITGGVANGSGAVGEGKPLPQVLALPSAGGKVGEGSINGVSHSSLNLAAPQDELSYRRLTEVVIPTCASSASGIESYIASTKKPVGW